jgi:hypothetical protein
VGSPFLCVCHFGESTKILFATIGQLAKNLEVAASLLACVAKIAVEPAR